MMTHEPPAPAAGTDDAPSTAAWWTFLAIAAALLPLMVLASSSFGVTWDEKARHKYGELILEFLHGQRSSASVADDGGQFYGGLFDVICATVERWLPFDRYVIRHAIDAVFGWIGIVYCGRLTRRFFGGWSGVLAMVLLVTSPRFFGESMNNPKDLPFAAMTVVALYYMSTIGTAWPYVSKTTAVKIVLPLAIALDIRAGALLYLGYLGLLVLALTIAERGWTWARLADTTLRLLAITVAVMVLGTAFWPWAQASPLTRPVQALIGLANFDWGGMVLFNGREYRPTNLPWSYAPWWLAISTPPVVIAGVVLALGPSRRGDMFRRAALWTVALVPLVLVIVKKTTLYDGIRHLLFVYPVFVVLAASGWTEWLSARRRPAVRYGIAALLAAGLANVMAFNVRAYPNQIVYFNELVGGPRGAFARFDMDYWGNCLLQTVSWSAKVAQLSGMPITVSGNPADIIQLDVQRFHEVSFAPPQRNQHHLIIRLNRGPVSGVTELAAREDALYRVRTPDGAVLCAVFPGPAFDRLQPHFVRPGS